MFDAGKAGKEKGCLDHPELNGGVDAPQYGALCGSNPTPATGFKPDIVKSKVDWLQASYYIRTSNMPHRCIAS
jgi:hypothetical protein